MYIDRTSSVPVYRQIAHFYRDAILAGDLPVGFRLLPERALADMIGANRSTVQLAYAMLKDWGLLESRLGQLHQRLLIGLGNDRHQ